MLLMATGKLVIDWTQMPTYNTIMSVAAGAGLISIVYFAREIVRGAGVPLDAWAIAFAVPGFILTVTGAHMTLTWPLAKYFPFDNIVFGETSLAFGVLLLATAFYLWKRGDAIMDSGNPAKYLARLSQPISIFAFGMGLGLIGIAAAGIRYQLFAAPPEEPITGLFAPYPWLEATGMSAMFGIVGIGAVLLPFAVRSFTGDLGRLQKAVGWAWGLTGAGFLLFGALNFFTHIGLIVNTMGPQ
ncbi:MAG: DUF981 domain-containing protein [Acidobacteriota bacterium]